MRPLASLSSNSRPPLPRIDIDNKEGDQKTKYKTTIDSNSLESIREPIRSHGGWTKPDDDHCSKNLTQIDSQLHRVTNYYSVGIRSSVSPIKTSGRKFQYFWILVSALLQLISQGRDPQSEFALGLVLGFRIKSINDDGDSDGVARLKCRSSSNCSTYRSLEARAILPSHRCRSGSKTRTLHSAVFDFDTGETAGVR